MNETIRVEGLRGLLRATDRAGKETKKRVRDELRQAAEPVKQEAQRLFVGIDARSASKFGITVRAKGTVSVEQRLRTVTGKRGDYGALQMRHALVPALLDNVDEVVDRLDEALERLGTEWGRGG